MKKMNKKNTKVTTEIRLTPAGVGLVSLVGGAVIGSTIRNGVDIYKGINKLKKKRLDKKAFKDESLDDVDDEFEDDFFDEE